MPNGKKPDPDPYQQILSRLGSIQHDVDSIKQTTAFTLRAEKQKHLDTVGEIFQKSRRRVQVYLAVNGQRSIKDIAKHLKMQGQNVWADLKLLREEELVDVVDSGAGGDIYAKTPIDRTLRISKFLKAEHGLTDDGLEKALKSK